MSFAAIHVQVVRLSKSAVRYYGPAHAVAVASYLHDIDPRAVEDIVPYPCPARSLHLAFLVCYFLGVDRELRVGASTFPLGKRTWVDHDNAIDHLRSH